MTYVRWTAIVLLGFIGLSGVAGGLPLLVDPQGTLLRMPLELLRYSPFHSFLIPGILLLCAIGLQSLWVLFLALRHAPHNGFWTAFQGCVLLVWLAVECWMLRLVMWAHWLYGGTSVALIIAGVILWRASIQAAPQAAATN